jgi:hypothetical protein
MSELAIARPVHVAYRFHPHVSFDHFPPEHWFEYTCTAQKHASCRSSSARVQAPAAVTACGRSRSAGCVRIAVPAFGG